MWASILLRSSRGCCRLSPSSSSKLCATCLSCQQHQRQHTNRFTANHQKQSQRCFYDGSRFLDKIGTANLDWENMRFEYLQTNCHKFHTWKNGDWDDGVMVDDPHMKIHILANVFHYGQALFEGVKAFQQADGQVRIFRDNMNFVRINDGCDRLCMPMIPQDLFHNAIDDVIRANAEYIPPHSASGSMYVRPFVFGSGPALGLGVSSQFSFITLVAPVGSYYKGGRMSALPAKISIGYDRAAPKGVGGVKAAGNYAADLKSQVSAKSEGYPISLYLDSTEQRYVQEWNTSNFVAVTHDGKFLTPPHGPATPVLGSVTNKSLLDLAEDGGLKVEMRPIDFVKEVDTFAEVGAVGTAVVLSPIGSIEHNGTVHEFSQEFPVLRQLHDRLLRIQCGQEEDVKNWCRLIQPTPDPLKSGDKHWKHVQEHGTKPSWSS